MQVSIRERANAAMHAAFASDDEQLVVVLELLSPAELLTLHRAAHHVAIEAARTRRRKVRREAERAKS
jgi:hypothetical protein